MLFLSSPREAAALTKASWMMFQPGGGFTDACVVGTVVPVAAEVETTGLAAVGVEVLAETVGLVVGLPTEAAALFEALVEDILLAVWIIGTGGVSVGL